MQAGGFDGDLLEFAFGRPARKESGFRAHVRNDVRRVQHAEFESDREVARLDEPGDEAAAELLTLADVEEATRIRQRYLEALGVRVWALNRSDLIRNSAA